MKFTFGLQPNAKTLAMVTTAARKAHEIELSLRAILMELGTMMTPFAWRTEKSRDELEAKIQEALATELTEGTTDSERDDQIAFRPHTADSSVLCLERDGCWLKGDYHLP